MNENDAGRPPNPNYGSGLFRRRVLLRSKGRRVVAELEDDRHAFRVGMDHDGHTIKDIEAFLFRTPWTRCHEAGGPIRQIVGAVLSEHPLSLIRYSDPRDQCTHLLDLVSLAMTHAKRGESVRQYDVSVWDEHEGEVRFEVCVNKEPNLIGMLREGKFMSPQPFTGQRIESGFISWGRKELPPDEMETALLLHRAYLVAHDRRFLLVDSIRAIDVPLMYGVCYAFGPDVIRNCISLPHSVRDFSQQPEKMLAFSNRVL